MKKFLKILLIVFLLILALLLVIPIAFKGKILELAQEEINRNLDAKVEFADLRLSLIRNFPNLHVALTGLSVTGTGDFENDTLVALKAFRTVLDIKSVIWGDEIEVVSILLDRPRIKTRVLADGRANWDIMKEAEPPVTMPDELEITVPPGDVPAEPPPPAEPAPPAAPLTAAEPAGLKVSLRKIEIRNGWFEYDDEPFEMRLTLDRLNGLMRGDLTGEITSLDISATSEIFNLWYEGIRYINDARIVANTVLDVDFNDFRFTFSDGDVLLNAMVFGIEGYFAMPGDDIETDLRFFSRKTDFKTLISLVPAIFMTGFEELEAWGNLTLEGFARGVMTDETMPSVGLDLVVENAGFSYPDLPKSLDNMHMSLGLYYDGVDEDKTTIDLHSFHMEMAGNPFDMSLGIRTPVSDMAVKATVTGTIDFTSLADVIPLEEVVIRGLLESDLSLSGKMSDIENERYEDFNAAGSLRLTAFRYEDPGFPQGVSIPRAVLDFSPRFVELNTFESQIGSSDIRMNGRLENFIPFIFNDGTVKGNLTLTSTLVDLNELLAGEPPEADTVPLTLVEVPGNIDFVLTSSIEKVLFDKMEISNLNGRIIVRDSKVMMEGVNMNMLGGSIGVRGEYNTQDMSAPFIDFALDISNFDIPSAFSTFNTVQQLTPIARDMRGSFSSSLSLRSLLGEDMMPVMNSISAKGRMRTSAVELVSSNTFDRLSQALSLRGDRDNVLRDLNIGFTVSNGRVYVDPFDARLGPVSMIIGGDQGIDQTMNFLVKMTVPRSEFGQGANQVIDNLVASAAQRGLNIRPGENVNVDARITGTFGDPQISLDMRESARATMEEVRDQIRSQAAEEVERRVEDVEVRVREELSESADKLLQEAEQRADQVRKTAAASAESIRKEGEAAAAKVEREAAGRGRLAEAAAKRTADGIRREAAAKADALVNEAEGRAEKILEDARREADRLR